MSTSKSEAQTALPESLAVENFSDDWYPPYKEVREVLVKTYQSFNKVWSGGSTKGLPTMLTTHANGEASNASDDERRAAWRAWAGICLGCKRKGCRGEPLHRSKRDELTESGYFVGVECPPASHPS